MQQAQTRDDPSMLDGSGLAVAIVQARFNVHITDRMAESCVQELQALGVRADDIALLTVPGALEIPQVLAALADSEQYDALIAIGCVIRGETYHFELVCDTSAAGLQQVALESGAAIANGIVTVENEQQAADRVGKGAECARVAVEMANLIAAIGSGGGK